MGILRDMLETVRDLKTVGSVENFFKSKKYSSISKRSLEGTLQFPVIVSRSMDIDTLQMISKSLERQFASFVQISLTMDPSLDISKEKDAAGYLRKFHQNSGVKTDLKDVMGSGLFEHFNVLSNEDETAFLISAVCEGTTANITASNKEQLSDLSQHVRTDLLNERFAPKKDLYNFPDRDLSDYHNGTSVVTEAPTPQAILRARKVLDNQGLNDIDAYRYASDVDKSAREREATDYKKSRDLIQDKTRSEETRSGHKPNGPAGGNYVPQNILRDNEARKANELIPTTLQIRTSLFDADKNQQGFFDFIIGVKTTMHPVTSDEMVTNVVGACKNNSKVFNFIRWTTGEISFFKDFLFNLQEIKDDVFNRSSGSSAWWITLKRRRALANMKNLAFMPGQLLPNATLVLSIDEVEYIKSEFGFDLMNVSFADKVMKQYFLLSLVVVDNSSQIAHFLFDGQTSYQAYTFGALEKENTNKADIKEVMKIINRTNMV
jgi:hypothetical protein